MGCSICRICGEPELESGDAAASGFTLLFMLPFRKLIDLDTESGRVLKHNFRD